MKYKELAALIAKMSPAQQDMDVSVLLTETDEVFSVNGLGVTCPNDPTDGILDDDHPYLTVPA